MHALQPKHIKLKPEEAKKLLSKYNLSPSQLPKIGTDDPAIPLGCGPGDILRIERKSGDKIRFHYRTIVSE